MPEGKIKLTVSGKSYRLKPGSPGFAGSNEEYGIKNTCGFTRMRMAILAVLVALFCAPQLRAQTPPLVGIAHVAFRVADLGKSQDFYRALGFQQAFEFTDAGKTSVVFIKINDHQFIELYPRTEESESLGLAHVCFETTVLESVRSEYLKQGLKPSEIEKGRAGNMLFDLLDFEGQLLEYIQYLPGSLHSLDRGKHLGGHRISQHLLEVGIPVRNVAAERTFYTTNLGFEHSGPAEAKLRLPRTGIPPEGVDSLKGSAPCPQGKRQRRDEERPGQPAPPACHKAQLPGSDPRPRAARAATSASTPPDKPPLPSGQSSMSHESAAGGRWTSRSRVPH
jgi:catechol 2,3-dioxygenase-like lactoylglutathione lyase family enzyme